MTSVSDIYNYIDSFAPFNTAMGFDNCGILIGDEKCGVSKALICLDITKRTLNEAKDIGAQLIISHHPVIFNPLTKVLKGSIVYELVENEISAICAHTNLDMARLGVNMSLAEKIGLRNVCGMDISQETNAPQWFSAQLENPLEPKAFANLIKEKLSAPCVKFTEKSGKIKKVGICSGSGAEFAENAARAGMDAFVTSEAKHHQLINAKMLDICLIDAGHFSTEAHIALYLKRILEKEFAKVEFTASKSEADPAFYV